MENGLEQNTAETRIRSGHHANSADAVDSIRSTTTRTCCPSAGHIPDEALLRELYRKLPYGVITTDVSGVIIAANESACRILGRPEGRLLGLRSRDLAFPDDPRLAGMIAQRHGGGACQGELTLIRGDGSPFEAEVASIPMDDSGAVLRSIVFRDISRRRRAEANAREQAQWLDRANEAIFVADVEHRIVYWNKGAERMAGWRAEEVLGQTMAALGARAGICDPEALEAAGRMVDWRGTISTRGRSGAPQVLAVSVTVLRDGRGEPTGRTFVATDITEYSRLQEKYERAQRLQSVGMLAAGVAHDLNNLLTPLCLGVPLLRENLSDPEDFRMLDAMQSSVARATYVVRQILGFTKGMGGQPQLIQAKHVLREIAGIIHETFPRSIAIEESIAADLWPVLANPTQLHQVLLNLCVNARDAMPEGGSLILGARNCMLDTDAATRIEGARGGAWLVISVQDTGVGIAPELLPQIWTPFFTTKPGSQGTGLGLSTVRDIVGSHGGFVRVESKTGAGSTFQVFLPAAEAKQSEEQGQVPALRGGGRGEVILLVEDETVVRVAAEAMLKKAGYRVIATTTGAAALAAVRENPQQFQLVLTDIDMPGLGGVELAKAVNRISPTLTVVAMSGLPEDAARRGFEHELLLKPFTGETLLRVVGRALAQVGRVAPEPHSPGADCGPDACPSNKQSI